jgi:hypothetical protein
MPPDQLVYVRFENAGHRLSQKVDLKVIAPGPVEDFEPSSFDQDKVAISCQKPSVDTLGCSVGDYPSGPHVSQVAIWHIKPDQNQRVRVVLRDAENFGEEVSSLAEQNASGVPKYLVGVLGSISAALVIVVLELFLGRLRAKKNAA